ncbi:MAG: gamma-glutamyltransferase [Casimicrobiaceae bacterium]
MPMTIRPRRWRWALFAAAYVAATAASPQARAPEHATGWTAKRAVEGRSFMVAAANPLAVDAGYRMLRRGGSAIDAAIAAQLVLGLVEPQSSGLGGGAFLLAHEARTHRLVAYDGRETAPAAARPDRFLDAGGKPLAFDRAVVGGRSVGVPGTVRLLEGVHRRHGKLPWRALFAPAIALAENGFAVSPRLHALIAKEAQFSPAARAYFLDADGKPRAVGAILRNPAYAATLRRIAAEGADAFYTGAIAQDIVDTVHAHPTHPGDLTLADLAGYRVKLRTPVCDTYRRYRVCGMPLPSSGGLTVLQILKLLEPYSVADMGPASFWSVHFMSEAGRLAYADRDVYEADPDFYTPPAGLLDPAYLRARSRQITTTGSLGRATPGDPPQTEATPRKVAWGENFAAEFPSTSHIVAVDRHGNAVSMTTTIEDAFGSRLMTSSGFLLNNELTDFSFVPLRDGNPVANRVEPGKRPRSSMAPTIVYDRAGRVFMVAGSPGGSAIINYVVKTLLGVIDWKLDPQAAIDLPNFGSRNGPTELEADTDVVRLEPKLRALGHDVRIQEHTSGVQAIVRTRSGWIGGADPRREGIVMGE